MEIKLFTIAMVFIFATAIVWARDYYVSPSGSDSNDGLTPQTAWKTVSKVNSADLEPGDRVLFEGGKTFAGTLTLDSNDSGTEGNPVTITSYGTGRATINNPSNAHGLSANGCRYLKITNINFVGLGRTTLNNGRGVYIQNSQHVEVDQVESSGFQKAGVEMRTSSDVRVTNVYAHDNGFAGIFAQNNCSNIYVGYCRAINNPGDPAITNNHSGNGILFYGTTDGLIEFCEAAENGWDQPWTGNGPVGIWAATSTRITIQYCISHNNKTRPGAYDGGGFDLDGGAVECVLQYNYSYENHGCGFLLCTWSANVPCRDNIVRYNISENDGQTNHFAGIYIHMGGSQSNTHVYNNIIYNSSGRNCVYGWCPSTFYFRNNIFILRGSGKFVDGVGDGVFQGNIYWNYDGGGSWEGLGSLAEWRTQRGKELLNGNPVGLHADPLLVNAGYGEKLTDPTKLPELFAYMLRDSASPCIDAGLNLNTLFGINPGSRDFYGNSIPQGAGFDIGACEWVSNRVATPTISPAGGLFINPVNVTISCATAGATIRYTTDGSTPSPSHGTIYTGAFTVPQSCTVKAIAYKNGMTDSAVASTSFSIVAPRNPENPPGTVPGLNVSYYELSSPSALPNFNSLTPYKTDTVSQIDYPSTMGNFATSDRADNVGAVFSGYIEAPSDGVYTFYTSSDDGSALYIGTTKVVDNDGVHPMQERSGSIGLKAGKHAFRVEFFEAAGGAGLIVGWEGPGISKQAIPTNRLYRKDSSSSDSDGDGLPDSWETQYFGSPGACAPDADPDSDGLTNREEYLRGTDPTKGDTDGDGMSDGFEVEHGFNPLNADQDGNGVLDGQDDWDGDGIVNALDSTPGAPPGAGGSGFSCTVGVNGCATVQAILIMAACAMLWRRRERLRYNTTRV